MDTAINASQSSPVLNQPLMTPAQKPKNKAFFSTILIISTIVLGLVGYYVWIQRNSKSITNPTNSFQKNNNVIDNTPQENSYDNTPTTIPINTSTWKIFNVPKYNFSFKYPPEYIVNAEQNDLIINESQEEKIKYEKCVKSNPIDEPCLKGIFMNLEYIQKQSNENLSDLSDKLLKELLPDGETTYSTIDTKPALQYVFRGKDLQYDIFIDLGNRILHIKAVPSTEEVFKELIKTIKLH